MSKVSKFSVSVTAVLLLITAALLCIKLFPISGVDTQINPRKEPDVRLVNINTASSDELDSLPGIGPSLASAIICYREEHGDFKTTRDIINVPGIGEKLFQNISDKITVGG